MNCIPFPFTGTRDPLSDLDQDLTRGLRRETMRNTNVLRRWRDIPRMIVMRRMTDTERRNPASMN